MAAARSNGARKRGTAITATVTTVKYAPSRSSSSAPRRGAPDEPDDPGNRHEVDERERHVANRDVAPVGTLATLVHVRAVTRSTGRGVANDEQRGGRPVSHVVERVARGNALSSSTSLRWVRSMRVNRLSNTASAKPFDANASSEYVDTS